MCQQSKTAWSCRPGHIDELRLLALGIESSGHAGAHRAACDIQAADVDGFAVVAVLEGDGIQCGDCGGVPEVGVGEVNDHVVGVFGVVEQGVEVIGGGEEQFACHRVMGYRLVAVAGDRAGDGGEA